MIDIPDSNQFDVWIDEAILRLPDHFRNELNNVSIVLEEEPKGINADHSMLLGLYQGIPNPLKGPYYTFTMPDKITLYKLNILSIANWRNIPIPDVIEEVLYHEIGHLLGMNEDELRKFGTI